LLANRLKVAVFFGTEVSSNDVVQSCST